MQAKSSPSFATSFRGNRTLLYGGVAAAVLIVIIASLVALVVLRQQIELRTQLSTQYLARSVEQGLEGMVDAVDIALLASADDIKRQMRGGKLDPKAIKAMLVRYQSRLPLVDNIRASNERGESLYGPDSQSPPVRIDDRDYFVRLRDDPKAGLFVSKPIVGRHKQKWIWLFARRIDKPDGSFGGVVFASVLAEQIEKLLSHTKMDPGSSLALRDGELHLIARYTFGSTNPIPTGDKRLSAPFTEAVKVNPQEGSFFSDASSVDVLPRSYSYHRSAKYGFTVNVGIPIETALADWRKEAWTIGGLVLVFVLAMLALLLQVGRAWRRQERDMASLESGRQALREHDARYRTAIESSSDGFWVVDVDGKILDANDAYARRSGYTREELLKLHVSDLEVQQASPESAARMKAISREGTATFETLHRAKNGTLWPVEASMSTRVDRPEQMLGFLRDISARKRAETLLQSRARFAELAQTGTLDELLQKVLDLAEEVTGSKIGFLHFVDQDQEHLTLQAWSTNTLAHMCSAEGKGQHYAISEAGVWVEAFHARAAVIHNDYASVARRKGLPEGHAPVIRELVIPILRKGKVTEIIGVGNKPTDYVQADVEALQLIAETVQDLTDRTRAEAEVRTLSRAMEQSPASVVITDRAGNIEYVNPRFVQVTGYTRSEVVGKNPRILKSGIVPDEVYAQLWAAISAGNEWRGELCNRRKNGDLFWEYAAISGLKDPGGEIGHYVAVKEDISERKVTESKLHRVSNLYAALSQCNQAVVHCSTEQELFQQICRAIVNYGGMKMAWIGMVDKASNCARYVAAYGDNVEYLEDLEISVKPDTPAGRGPTGIAIRENRPYWCQDFQNDPATAYWRESGRIAGWGGSASVPLRKNGAAIGALTLYSSEVNAFDEAARSLLVEMGGNISFALDHFVHEAERSHAEKSLRQAHEQLRQLAMRLNRMHEAESNLLSRELHDEFGQMLTSLKMDLSWLALRLGEKNSDLKRKVDASLDLVDASVKSVRSIAARLRPRILDELGLLPAIDWLVQDFRERSGIDAAFVADAQVGTLSSERATAVFRIVQESLSNIARHADAKCIDVSLHEENGWLTLEVRDDGKGVRENEKTSYESIGLLGMRERALAAGGKIMFDSVLGRGTVVTLRLPVAEPGA